jgi:uncharacterized RDD family membrane protein YckC
MRSEASGEPVVRDMAPLGRRVVAGTIDLLIMIAVVPIASLLTGVLVGWFYELARSPEIDVEGAALVISIAPIVAAVIVASYEPSWIARMGRTPGKAAMGMWVVTDDGTHVPLGVAFVRGLLKVVSVLPLGLGFWNAAFDSRRKTWHDLFLGTIVSTSAPVDRSMLEPTRSVPAEYMNPAHPFRRFGARVIDTFILLVGALLLLTFGHEIAKAGLDQQTGGIRDSYAAVVVLLYGVFLVAVALYEIALIGIRGQTIGKMAMGVRVVGVDGKVPGWRAAALRWACTIGVALIPYIGPFVVGLVFLWVAWDRNGQGLHDKIAGTRVVADEPGIRIVGARNPEEAEEG